MKWRKLGMVYRPAGNQWWARNYAHLPTADVLDDKVIRVYFASLDENRFGRIGFADVAADDPRTVFHVTEEPILHLGQRGTFDDCGVTPSCLVTIGNEKYLYYIGWQRCETVPYMLFVGLAISRDGGATFEKYSRVPVLDRTADEPFSRSAPCVLKRDGFFEMWYWTCVYWVSSPEETHYYNVIKRAGSLDSVHWSSDNQACITPAGPNDYSVGRPWVIREDGLWKMWYSIRSCSAPKYRIGYAESENGMEWKRRDDLVGIAASNTGWDSEMICYPCVVDAGGRRYMFYNGNGHGRTGFGCAVLE